MEITRRDNAVEYVRKNATMFFRSGRASAREGSTNLASDALLSGASTVSIVRDGLLWIVGADVDWLVHATIDISDLFIRLVPFPEAGANTVRSEVVIGAFANVLAIVDSVSIVTLRGMVDETSLRAQFVRHGWVRAVAFTFFES